MDNLIERMVRYRAKESISQGEFARRCGLSAQTVNSIENGTQTASKRTIAKIELLLEKSEDNG